MNATYQHCAFGLRYLQANLGELRSRARLLEFTIAQNPRDIAEAILREKPTLVGLGVYIWNTRQTEEVVGILKAVAPEIVVVLGGPEVSFESESQSICALADYVIQGEGETAFAELCRNVLAGDPPAGKFIRGELPDVEDLAFPYELYTAEDVRNRILYVEASRGCPYRCEFCLSSLDKSVRCFPIEPFLEELDWLIARGARQFKFVDRTFNLSPKISGEILDFFLERVSLGLFLHFEMVPDRLPEELRERIQRFPSGSLQFEIGIQTWNPDVAARVSRRQDDAKVEDNFRFLTRETGVHLHADLIAGLPGESMESFAGGFDRLFALRPHEIQLGILKRLKGTPILRHDAEWGMIYHRAPPFPVLRTSALSYEQLQELQRFAKFWDLYANSGNFPRSMALLMRGAPSAFRRFRQLSRFLAERHPQGHGIALMNQTESLWLFLLESEKEEEVRAAALSDYCGGSVKRDVPPFLRPGGVPKVEKAAEFTVRQRRHQANSSGSPDGPRAP